MGTPKRWAAFDGQTARSVLAALAETGAAARACAQGARLLAKEAGGFAGHDGTRAAAGATGTAEWCVRTQLELRRRLLASGVAADDPVLGPPPMLAGVPGSGGFTGPAAARRAGAADGRALARALSLEDGRWPGAARLNVLAARAADPEYAAALVEQLPPEALGRAAVAELALPGQGELGGLYRIVAAAETVGALSDEYRRRLLHLPPTALGPLLALGTFSVGFVVAAVTAMFGGQPGAAAERAQILGMRAAADQPAAARALLAAPRTAYAMLHLAAGWPGLDPAVRADADTAAARVLRSGLTPDVASAAEITTAWRSVLETMDRHPDLLGLAAARHRPVHRALAEIFVPYLPYAAWQAAASGATDAQADTSAQIGVVRPLEPTPVLVPCYSFDATARFLGLVIADRDAFGVLRAGALRHVVGDLGVARYIAVERSPGRQQAAVVLQTGLVGRGALLTGLFSLLGRAAAEARLAFTDRVAAQGAALQLILGAPLGLLDRIPGAEEILDATVVNRLADWFVRRRTAAGPHSGPAVLAALADECARRVADRIRYPRLGPAERAAARLLVRDVVRARVVDPLLLLTDPGAR